MINYCHRRSSSAAAQRLFSSSTRLTTSKQNFISCEYFCQHHHHLVYGQVDCSQAEGGEEQFTGDVKAICFLQLHPTRTPFPPTLSNLNFICSGCKSRQRGRHWRRSTSRRCDEPSRWTSRRNRLQLIDRDHRTAATVLAQN